MRASLWWRAVLGAAFVALAAATAPAEDGHGGGGEEGGHGGHERFVTYNVKDATDPILFMFLSLLVGAVLQLILVRLPPHWPKPPYTVLLFLSGFILGASTYEGDLKILGHATRGMVNMDPHLVLYVFLPPLLFESAFSMTSHVFTRCFPQAFLLAGPGVIITSGLTGILCRGIFSRYAWGWTLSLMFGAMVSATDPVAVVGLLVELSAAKPLSTVIEAESLMNDGSAFVIFLILLDFAAGNPATVGEVIGMACRMALGGPALGLAFGLAFDHLLHRFCINDPIIEVSLTITAAYLSFWTAETVDLKASGVLTVVTLGAYMGGAGKARISPEIHHNLHHVWSFLGHLANTVIFVLSGAFTYNLVRSDEILLADWGYLVLLYIIVHITRGITICMLWWGLKSTGYGVSIPRGMIMWYGGLRGAVGLVLALLVSHEEGISVENRARIQFLTAGLVALTIGVNGTTAGLLYKKLGLAETTRGHRATIKLSVDYVESNADSLALNLDQLDFWGAMVREDIKKEYDEMAKRRPHRIFQGKHDWSDFSESEKLKKKIVRWFDVQPVWAGRKLSSISHVTKVAGTTDQYDVEFCHIFNPSERWPPPVHATLKFKYYPTVEQKRFTIDSLEETGKVTAVASTPVAVHDVLQDADPTTAKGNNVRFNWYPDFSRILSRDPVGWLAKNLNENFGKDQVQRPLLGDIREDLRRILIVSVRHRYEQWSEERLIEADVFSILEEALLYVEDEDHLYDLHAEYDRILDGLGLCENGTLSIALRESLDGKYNTANEPFADSASEDMHNFEDEPDLVADYWSSRTDARGKVLGSTISAMGGFSRGFAERFTLGYLHGQLRLAIHSLMFYTAAHISAWEDIQKLWGALLAGDEAQGERGCMQDEEELLKSCYHHAEEVIWRLVKTLPDIEGIIAGIHEDFIHNLLVAQMKESVSKCLAHGLLTDGDSSSMKAVIQRKLRPFFRNPFLGDGASRLKGLVARGDTHRSRSDQATLPKFLTIEHLMHEQQKKPIMSKKTFWEIKFISRLQFMAYRNRKEEEEKGMEEEEEEAIAFVTIDGVGARSRGSGSFHGSLSLDEGPSPFHGLAGDEGLAKRYAHLSSHHMTGVIDDDISVGDPVALTARAMEERHRSKVERKENLADSCAYEAELSPTLLQTLRAAKTMHQLSRKGWVRAERHAEDGRRELLVHCSLVPEEDAWTWYPAWDLRCAPMLMYEELNEKSNPRACHNLRKVIRCIWLRAAVDRTRQVLADKFPYVIEAHWLTKKEATHAFIGTNWPWWGCIVEQDNIVFTEKALKDEDGNPTDEPDFEAEVAGVLLKRKIVCWEGPNQHKSLVRDKHTMRVIEVPSTWWREPEYEVVESHYSCTTGLLPSSAFVPFVVGNTEYSTTEHYYQASKFADFEDEHREARLEYRRRIIEARTAKNAQELGHDKQRKGPPIVANWEAVRDVVMMTGLRAKFTLNHGIRPHHTQLLQTGERVLLSMDKEEHVVNHWGVSIEEGGRMAGHNLYGKLLMLVRNELRHEIIAEKLLVAALCVLASASPMMGQDFRVGERVKVRMKSRDPWKIGTVHAVTADRSTYVLALGETEPRIFPHVQSSTPIQLFCPHCGHFQRGNAGEVGPCSNSSCQEDIPFPDVAMISTHAGEVRRTMALSPGAPILPPKADADGVVYHSVDHFYQAAKFVHNGDYRRRILNAPTAEKTIMLGSDREGPAIRGDWDDVASAEDIKAVPEVYKKILAALGEKMQVRIHTMIKALNYKFELGTEVLPRHQALIATGNQFLMYDDREDTLAALFWGVGPLMTGLNVFGHLLMAAREKLREDCVVLEGVLVLAAVAGATACVGVAGDRPFKRGQYAMWWKHGFGTPGMTPGTPMWGVSARSSPMKALALERSPDWSGEGLANVVREVVARTSGQTRTPPRPPAPKLELPSAAKTSKPSGVASPGSAAATQPTSSPLAHEPALPASALDVGGDDPSPTISDDTDAKDGGAKSDAPQ